VIVYLPHDGVATNNITGKRYIDHWTEAGFECGIPIKNTGAGAAMMRIEAALLTLELSCRAALSVPPLPFTVTPHRLQL
jgi:hypothetical protein